MLARHLARHLYMTPSLRQLRRKRLNLSSRLPLLKVPQIKPLSVREPAHTINELRDRLRTLQIFLEGAKLFLLDLISLSHVVSRLHGVLPERELLGLAVRLLLCADESVTPTLGGVNGHGFEKRGRDSFDLLTARMTLLLYYIFGTY